jgi:hypothetical protein
MGYRHPMAPSAGHTIWNPGSPSAPHVTITRRYGVGGDGLRSVFLRKGTSSADTLGYGVTGSVGLGPTVTVNSRIPDVNGVPQPWQAEVSSIEPGVGLPGFALTRTMTPQQIADFIAKYLTSPAMGPDDELSPFVRTLQSGRATIGTSASPPVPFLTPSEQSAFGTGMGVWRSSAGPDSLPPPSQPPAPPRQPGSSSVFDTGAPPVAFPPSGRPGGLPGLLTDAGFFNPADPGQSSPGGLPGLILDYLRNNRDDGLSR